MLHPGHVRSERLGKLHGERTDAARRTVDQDLLLWLKLADIAKHVEGDASGLGNGRGLLEREVHRLRHEVVLASTHILGEGTLAPAEYLITWLNLRHVLADRFNLPRDIRAPNTVPWFAQPVRHADDVRQASHDGPVSPIDGSRVNAYQHLIVVDYRLVDVRKFEDIR